MGIKLDFKEADCVAPCLALLVAHGVGMGVDNAATNQKEAAATTALPGVSTARSMPLWLNADVVCGPGGRDPIPGQAFVRRCVAACPGATLSLGWTHTGTPVLGYTASMVSAMLRLCEDVPQHVTLAASAAHLFASAAGPRNALIAHVNGVGGSSDGLSSIGGRRLIVPQPISDGDSERIAGRKGTGGGLGSGDRRRESDKGRGRGIEGEGKGGGGDGAHAGVHHGRPVERACGDEAEGTTAGNIKPLYHDI